jgi:uncharacterized protein
MQDSSGSLRLSASDLSSFLACRHLTALDFAHLRGLVDRPRRIDAVSERLRELGYAHEQRYVDALRRRGEVVDLRGHLDADTRTLEAMHHGAAAIVQAKFETDGWLGYADVLQRVDRPSRLGSWSYEVYDTKLARETRGGTILQLVVYSELVGHVQGVLPDHFHVVTPDPATPIHTFRIHDFAAYVRLIRGQLVEALQREAQQLLVESYPEPVAHCEICRWWSYCNGRRRQDDHLSFIANVTRLQRSELVAQGFSTVALAGRMPLPIAFEPLRGSAEAFARVREQARVQLEQRSSGLPVYELLDVAHDRGLCRLPEPSRGDVFVDLEGDPFAREGGREYLFGVDAAGSSDVPTYTPRWAVDDGQERAAFEALIDLMVERWDADPGMHVYHFGGYEPAAMKRLMGRYGTRADALDRLLRGERFVDLAAIARHALRAGVESYSLKKLEPLYGFTREIPLDEANAHLRAAELALEANAASVIPASTRHAIESYNRDDCRSARVLRDWLEERRAEQVRGGVQIPRPEPAADTAPERVSQLAVDVELLRDQLLSGVPAVASARDLGQQIRWMLAYLIDWHRRETKAEWWEFFRLCELPEDELLDEPLAIAGLTFTQTVENVTHNRTGRPTKSVVDRYRYPAQDVEIRRKGKLQLQDGRPFGEVASIDRDGRVIDIRKSSERAALHPRTVFSASVVPTEGLQRSVMRVASDVAAGGMNCAADLLYRRSPRLRRESFGPRPGETAVERVERLVVDLQDTTLAIQGPPGAGKTYAAARMICRLVAEGRRVGVTAVSHRVIRNLLDAVGREAVARGLAITLAHKVSEQSDGSNSPVRGQANGVREFIDNDEALAAFLSGGVNVLGGTAWLWSRPDAHRAADMLFVDEAGQMSLASVLAVAPAAASLVLLGDPQQLEQPQKASHPEGIGVSALEYLLDGRQTMPDARGVFLPATWRLAPAICEYTSEAFYDGKLKSRPGLEGQQLVDSGAFDGAGLWWVPVAHYGNQSSSLEEVDAIARIVNSLLERPARWIDEHGTARAITPDDFRVVAPYNAQVNRLKERLDCLRVPIGTVDRFQGQESPIAIYSMTSSSSVDAPRGIPFLYSLNRLNVASSRARCAVIIVAAPALFEPECRTPQQMRLVNALCRFREMAHVVDIATAFAVSPRAPQLR